MYYDYLCPKCKDTKEVKHSMTESPIIKCYCGAIMKIKISNRVAVHFKGDGYTQSSLN